MIDYLKNQTNAIIAIIAIISNLVATLCKHSANSKALLQITY